MRFLMICMQYAVQPGQSYMTTDLADALEAAGHEVEVLFVDWDAASGEGVEVLTSPTGTRVVRCPAKAFCRIGDLVRKASKFILTGSRAARVAREYFDLNSFDAAVAWMPATAIAPVVPLLAQAGIRHRLLFIWDFFPDHYREIGRMSRASYLIARSWERRLLKQFTAFLCTLPKNADYFRRNYPLHPMQRVFVTPIWSDMRSPGMVDRAVVRARHGLPPDAPIVVFGGQLVEGRGFDQMLGAATAGKAAGSPLIFLFVGDGRLTPLIKAQAEFNDNVRYLPPMMRQDYLELLAACDVGMVATVPGVNSYTIPIKTLNYLHARLPVIAAVEPGNDYVSILNRYRLGKSVPFNEPDLFFEEAERLATSQSARSAAADGAALCLAEIFDVRHTVAAVMKAVNDDCSASAEPAGSVQ